MSKDIKTPMSIQTSPSDLETGSISAATQLENQLSEIISSAQQIAVIAEELLREFSATELKGASETMSPMRLRQTIQAAAVAPRLLSATQQQLDSLQSMLRNS